MTSRHWWSTARTVVHLFSGVLAPLPAVNESPMKATVEPGPCGPVGDATGVADGDEEGAEEGADALGDEVDSAVADGVIGDGAVAEPVLVLRNSQAPPTRTRAKAMAIPRCWMRRLMLATLAPSRLPSNEPAGRVARRSRRHPSHRASPPCEGCRGASHCRASHRRDAMVLTQWS